MNLDDTDRRLLRLLQEDDRQSHAQLGKAVGLAVSSVNERIRKLVDKGAITGFHARVSPEVVGAELLCFLYVGWNDPATEPVFLRHVLDEACVLECHHVAGPWNYLLKVRTRSTAVFECFLSKIIKSVQGVERTETVIVLNSCKETSLLPTSPASWISKQPAPSRID